MRGESCRDRRGDLASVAVGHLDLAEHPELGAHLDGCAGCRDELEALRTLVGVLALADPDRVGSRHEPPPDLGDRILERVAAERRARRRRLVRRVAVGAAAAAVVAAGLVAGLAGVIGDSDDAAEMAPFTDTVAGAEGAFALEPNEGGTAVVLHHEGLDPDTTYWLWLADERDRRVSAGTFTGASGDSPIVLQSALALQDAARIWATDAEDRVVLDALLDTSTS